METLLEIVGYATYGVLGLLALWGLYCVLVVWRRVIGARFRSEDAQDAFLDELDQYLQARDFDSASALCEQQGKALPQLIQMAIDHRSLGYQKLRHVAADRFQRDVLSDLEHRLSWVLSN